MTETANQRRPEPVSHLTGRTSSRDRPEGISLPGAGGKFGTDGSVQFWPGNTFVRHVASGPSLDAIRALQEELRMSRFGPFFTYLPVPSMHMTVFQGISPAHPAEFDRDHRDRQTAGIMGMLDGIAFPPERHVRCVGLFAAHSLTVTGAGPETEIALRQERQVLRDATSLRPADFETYVFHITLGYQREWLSEGTALALVAFSNALFARHQASLQAIELGPNAFCSFDTMHHFEPLRPLV